MLLRPSLLGYNSPSFSQEALEAVSEEADADAEPPCEVGVLP